MAATPNLDREADRLATLRGYSILDTLPEQSYEDIVALASYICDAPIALISLVDQDRQWFKSKLGLDASETARSASFCAHSIVDAKTLVVENAETDARFASNPLVLGDPRIRFYAGAPLIAPNGHVLGTVCVIDTRPRELTTAQISALEALSRQVIELFESRAQLLDHQRTTAALMQTEKLAAVGRLASSIAHEINNPLESVTNLLYLSRSRAEDVQLQEWLAAADLELRRVSNIAKQTLRFHRQSSKPRPITCTDLFSTALALYEARLRNARISVETPKSSNKPVACYEGDVLQVLSNIISNAIDAMPHGGRLIVRGCEATDWTMGRQGLILTIADTGTGIDKQTQARMYEAFFTTKGIRGSGLGLWISADIMNRHHGRISIRSSQREGMRGTVVNLFIPYECD
jgi:signal transduction histidine kinase